MNDTDLWLVTNLKYFPISKCFHFFSASTMEYASFSTEECQLSVENNVPEKNATGLPFWFLEALVVLSDVSVFTSRVILSSTVTNAKFPNLSFGFSNAADTFLGRGKVQFRTRGRFCLISVISNGSSM